MMVTKTKVGLDCIVRMNEFVVCYATCGFYLYKKQ